MISGTELTGSFSYAIVKWLVDEFGDNVELDSSEAEPETVKLFFRQLLPAVEYQNISDRELNLLQRIKLLKRDNKISSLQWLVNLLDESNLPDQTKEFLFNELHIYIKWRLEHKLFSSSFIHYPTKKIVFHKQLNKFADANKILKIKLSLPYKLSTKQKRELISIARATLVFLYRETDPFSYADLHEVSLFELEDGISIALYSMDKEHRFSIESYIGYLALKNGMPVAYGGGWIFGERCQFGINVLEPFRNGESGVIFSQLLRVYHQHFGVKRFVVKPYQFGKDNKEALQSGAFWFYYKYGFRPEDRQLKSLAEQEWKKKKANKEYRSSADILKRFTASDLFLNLSSNPVPLFDASVVSSVITEFINEKYKGDRETALKECSKETLEILFLKDLSGWNHYEKKAWQQWSLLTQAALSVYRWDAESKKQLQNIIKAKAGNHEMDFIKRLQQHQQFWKDLCSSVS
jgi:hypothetical protein